MAEIGGAISCTLEIRRVAFVCSNTFLLRQSLHLIDGSQYIWSTVLTAERSQLRILEWWFVENQDEPTISDLWNELEIKFRC